MRPTTPKQMAAIATLLGASLLMSAPMTALADQGKWWQPKESKRTESRRTGRVERRAETRRYYAPPRGFDRQYRQWRGNRVYRDVIVIRDSRRGPRYRAWRSYAQPEFIYRRHIVRVRPVRYYVSAVFGGVHISVQNHDDYYYGCNFCDARFDSYGAYRAHVYECDARPRGYQIVTNDWNDRELRDRDWWDDHNWERDHAVDWDRGYDDRNQDYGDDQDEDGNY